MQIGQPSPLWSGPDAQAIQLGSGAAGDYYQVSGPAQGSRVPVTVARTSGPAWVDTAQLKPSAAPSGLAADATSATSRVGGHPWRRRSVGRRRRQAPAGAGAGRERVQTTRSPAGVAATRPGPGDRRAAPGSTPRRSARSVRPRANRCRAAGGARLSSTGRTCARRRARARH